MSSRKLLTVVLDGIGETPNTYGNAVKLARTPHLTRLGQIGPYRTLTAHGCAVGLPSDGDMGNSEVGHNALGAGKIYDQGAKLVNLAISSGRIYTSRAYLALKERVLAKNGALHLIGLLSDGNVHSHQDHLYAIMANAKKDGIKKVCLHVLLDGRDVPAKSAKNYAAALEKHAAALRSDHFKVVIASGGGRMTTTMDRYEADWSIVERGFNAHVHGKAARRFASLEEAIDAFYAEGLSDQNFPAFVICGPDGPLGKMQDGDAAILFNFRGDRAIEFSQAFAPDFSQFDRGQMPDVFYAGMMEYEGDLHIPENYLVEPPEIKGTLSEHLAAAGLRQFACSETQKYGHVTYFWNGNRTGKFDEKTEEYLEIPSDTTPFHLKPWMKASEITDETIKRLYAGGFDFGRINLANGDMVGHTGDLDAAVMAVSAVDIMVGRLLKACHDTGTILVVTADHGNADEMYDGKEGAGEPKKKTSHTLNPVPFYIYDPLDPKGWQMVDMKDASIGHLAASVMTLMGLAPHKEFLPSIVRKKDV